MASGLGGLGWAEALGLMGETTDLGAYLPGFAHRIELIVSHAMLGLSGDLWPLIADR